MRDGAESGTRWMAQNAGGSAVTDDEIAALAKAAGFAAPIAPPGAPRVLVCRTD